jgi:hypothetical protein
MVGTAPSDLGTTRTIFYAVAVLMAIYGLGLLLFPHAIFTLSDDPGAVPANPGRVRWGGGFVLGTAVAAWLAGSKPESQRPLMMGLATAFTLVTLALQQSRWRLSWSAIVELVADIGQRGPSGRDVVANVQICRVDNLWLSKERQRGRE